MAAAFVVVLLALAVVLQQGLLGRPVSGGTTAGTSADSPGAGRTWTPPAGEGIPATAAVPPTATSRPDVARGPRIVVDRLTFGALREAETAAYAAP